MQTCLLCRRGMQAWLPAIQAHKKNFTLKKGDTIFKEGDPVNGIFFLYAGKMKVHKHWADGKELIVRFAKEGDIVGHRGIGTELVYPVTATALEASSVCFFEIDFFNASLKVNHDLLYELMQFYARELMESEKSMRNLAHMSVKGRLANALLTLKNKFGFDKDGFIAFPLSKQDMSSYIGATYETTFRMMNELINDQIIAVSGKHITIKQEEKLRLLIRED